MELIIKQAILKAILNTNVRCFNTSGGWVIEAINPSFIDDKAAEDSVLSVIQKAVPSAQPTVIIWKIFVYSDESQAFSVAGTLHTKDFDYEENGIHTTYLQPDDCYINLTEFDAEILQLGDYNALKIEALEAMSDDGSPLLKYSDGAQYLWLEALGGCYTLTQPISTLALGGNKHPRRIEIHLAEHEGRS